MAVSRHSPLLTEGALDRQLESASANQEEHLDLKNAVRARRRHAGREQQQAGDDADEQPEGEAAARRPAASSTGRSGMSTPIRRRLDTKAPPVASVNPSRCTALKAPVRTTDSRIAIKTFVASNQRSTTSTTQA